MTRDQEREFFNITSTIGENSRTVVLGEISNDGNVRFWFMGNLFEIPFLLNLVQKQADLRFEQMANLQMAKP